MPLRFPGEWKFEGVGVEIPSEAGSEFFALVQKIAVGDSDPKRVYEAFKSAFGNQSHSSSASWAESDLAGAMRAAWSNAAIFVASLWQGMEDVKQDGTSVPSAAHLNKILDKWDVPLVVDPPHLRLKEGDIVFASTDEAVESSPIANAYVRGEELGHGGFGTVYRVTRTTKAGTFEFAMKVLDPSPFIENKERALARFRREMQVLQKLQHRGIVQHIEAGLDGDQKPYILMPLIEGPDLREALSGVEPAEVFAVFDEILSALEYAHSKGVVHRDLKPSNILVRLSDRQPIILDFGCAYLFDDADETSLTTTLIGSAPYMPIEVIRNPKHRTVQQDVYACGILLYEVLAGCLPNAEEYEPLEKSVSGFEGLDRLVQKAIAPEKQRFEGVGEFRKHLKAMAT